MIRIEVPKADITISRREQIFEGDEPEIKPINGFIDLHQVTRDKGGIFTFYNEKDELLFVGKARKLRQRIKKHFEDSVSPIKNYRDEVQKVSVFIVEDSMERDIYETYIINTLKPKYNVDKVFYK